MSSNIQVIKKEIVGLLLNRGFLPDNSLFDSINDEMHLQVLHKVILGNPQLKKIQDFLELASISRKDEFETEANVKIIVSHGEFSGKKDLSDFVAYFNFRYQFLSNIIRSRQEMRSASSISRIIGKPEKESVSIIGMVKSKQETKNGNILIILEDQTGEFPVLVTKNNIQLYNESKNIVLDEVVGVSGTIGRKMIYVSSIIWPEIPLIKELKKAPDESYAIFLSDLHVGSNYFLKDDFNKFLKWINGEIGRPEQKEIVKKIKYAFFIGDMVDGVGIYPEQEKELEIKDIYEQYKECARLLKKIPSRIKLIISPGNHDAGRIAEPQPALYKDVAKPIWDLPNAYIVSNPAYINIHSNETFPGFDVLMYHGYSFDYYVANVDSIRTGGGYNSGDLIMKFLLKRRHLAPTHTSSNYIPTKDDLLLIDKIPDMFVTGHIHKTAISTYRNITLLSGSCWQSKTAFQVKVGHNPDPAQVPLINLKTREIKIMRFKNE